jgi:hypothetical protein
MFFSIFLAYVKSKALQFFRGALGYLMLYYLIINTINTEKRLKGFLWTLILSHIVIIILNPGAITGGRASVYYFTGAFFLGDGNDFSLSVIAVIPLTLGLLFLEKSKLLRLILLASLTAFLGIIFILESRASFLSILLICFYIWLKSRRKFLGIIVLVVAGISFLVFSSGEYNERMQTITKYEEDNSASSRIFIWQTGFKMALDYPLGVGAGNFSSIYGRHYRSAAESMINWGSGRWLSPHSMYVQCLTELGFIGFIILISLLIHNIKQHPGVKQIQDNNNKLFKVRHFFYTSNLGFALNAAFIGVLYYPHIFVLTGIIVAFNDILIRSVGNND